MREDASRKWLKSDNSDWCNINKIVFDDWYMEFGPILHVKSPKCAQVFQNESVTTALIPNVGNYCTHILKWKLVK